MILEQPVILPKLIIAKNGYIYVPADNKSSISQAHIIPPNQLVESGDWEGIIVRAAAKSDAQESPTEQNVESVSSHGRSSGRISGKGSVVYVGSSPYRRYWYFLHFLCWIGHWSVHFHIGCRNHHEQYQLMGKEAR